MVDVVPAVNVPEGILRVLKLAVRAKSSSRVVAAWLCCEMVLMMENFP